MIIQQTISKLTTDVWGGINLGNKLNTAYSGDTDPHIYFHFLNQTLFPLEDSVFENHELSIAKRLMTEFQQNKSEGKFSHELVISDHSDEVKPRIFESYLCSIYSHG